MGICISRGETPSLSLLVTSPGSSGTIDSFLLREQKPRSVLKHVLRVIVRKLDPIHHNATVIHSLASCNHTFSSRN